MKRLLVASSLIILILATSAAGCTGLLDTKKTNTPEATLKTYISAFNRGDSDTIYDLLSSQAKSTSRKSDIKDIMELASEFQMQYDDYKILSKDVVGDTATLKVEISSSMGGKHLTTSVETMRFVKEGNEWKIQGTYMQL